MQAETSVHRAWQVAGCLFERASRHGFRRIEGRTILLAFAWACTPRSPVEDPPSSAACESGFVSDGGSCVPESCGSGPWGSLPIDDATVFVDRTAEEGGDGTQAAPYATIQRGANRAGALGGGLVAVAAGIYRETLAFTSEHAEVHLAGRCREMVTLEADIGEEETPGIEIDARTGAVEVSGITVGGASGAGIVVVSGEVAVRDAAISGGRYLGVVAWQTGSGMIDLVVDHSIVDGNTGIGILADGSDTRVVLRDTTVQETIMDENGEGGWGIAVQNHAVLSAADCLIEGNTDLGLWAKGTDVEVVLQGTAVRGTLQSPGRDDGAGISVEGGAMLSSEDGLVVDNTVLGLIATDPGTRVAFHGTTVMDTLSAANGNGGWGIQVQDGASFFADDSLVDGNAEVGVIALGQGSQGGQGGHVVLRDTTVRDTHPSTNGTGGWGILVVDDATLAADACLIVGNTELGLMADGQGTEVVLRETTVKDTFAAANGEGGRGIQVQDGARVSTDGCLIAGNTEAGLSAETLGTQIFLRNTTVRDTQRDVSEGGFGISVMDGAVLSAEGCLVQGNSGLGVFVGGTDTQVSLLNTTVKETRPESGGGGAGIEVLDGAVLLVDGCLVTGNTCTGVLADRGSRVMLRDSTVSDTRPNHDLTASTATGVAVQREATLSAVRLTVASTQGPGLLVNTEGALLECVGCLVEDNLFAGGVALNGGTLSISDSIIEGTMADINLLGGAGIYAWPWEWSAPTVILTNTIIQDNPIAGVWLNGQGTYVLNGNTITGGIGESFGSGSRCGDAILALDGIAAWDGTTGLLLLDNTFQDASGSGIFLDNSSAWMSGNTYSDNSVDLVVQNQSCETIPSYYSEAPQRDLCPTYSHPTCNGEFFWVALPADPVD